MDPDHVSHGDIYHKLGTMEGKIESVLVQMAERRNDMNNLFTRMREIETKVAVAMGAVAILSVVMPFVIDAMNPRIHLEQPPATVRPSAPAR